MADKTFGSHGWTPERLGPQKGKTFLITGGNAGAGFEATRILLGEGAKVVMLNRSAERSEAAVAKLKEEFGAGAEVSFVRMDLADLDSVREAADGGLGDRSPHRRPHLQRGHRAGPHADAHC